MVQVFEHLEVPNILVFAILIPLFLVFTIIFALSMIDTVAPDETAPPLERTIRIGSGVMAIVVAFLLVGAASTDNKVSEKNLMLFEHYYNVDILESMSSIPTYKEPQGIFILTEKNNPDVVISCNVSLVENTYEFICTDTSSVAKKLTPADQD